MMPKQKYIAGGAVIVLMVVVYALMSWYTPWQFDDLLFISTYREINGSDAPSWQSYLAYFNQLRTLDNSRLSNELYPVIVLWPGTRVLFNILTGVMMAAILWFSVRIASGRWRVSGKVAIFVWCAMLLVLPWRNNIFVSDYTLNYIFSSALALGFAIVMLKLAQKRFSAVGYILTLLYASLEGAWHEGFALPLLCGLGILGIVEWHSTRKFRLDYWAVLVVNFAVILIFMLSPGIINRAGRELGGGGLMYALPRVIINNYLVVLTIIIALAMSLRRSGRKVIAALLTDRVALLMAVTSLVGLAICFFVKPSARTAFWPQLTALVLWLRIAYLKRLPHVAPLARRIALAAAMVLIAVQTVSALTWQRRFYVEHQEIVAEIESGNSTVFRDVIAPDDVPWYTLYMPARMEFYDLMGQYSHNQYYGRTDIAVVPTALNVDVAAARPLGSHFYAVNEHVVADYPLPNWPFIEVEATLTLNDGTTVEAVYDGQHFADATGARRTWLIPRSGLLRSNIPDATLIKSIVVKE